MNDRRGFVFGYRLDGKGGAIETGWDERDGRAPKGTMQWLHLDYTDEEVTRWLKTGSGIDEVVCEILTAEETRPRSLPVDDGLLVILRGVNLNPGADPEDMVSIRMWIEKRRVITVRHRRVMAVENLRASLVSGKGPTDAGSFLEDLADRLVTRMGVVLSDLDDAVDALEDEVLTRESYELRPKIADIRRKTISIRRYLAPQREVMSRLQNERVGWLDDMARVRLREIADRTTRYVEDLDSIRDRAAVTQEELNSRLAEQMNKTMYVLSIVAGIFLPLGLLTGLLGINVGGMPGTDSASGFAIVCAVLAVIVVAQIYVFRRMRWL